MSLIIQSLNNTPPYHPSPTPLPPQMGPPVHPSVRPSSTPNHSLIQPQRIPRRLLLPRNRPLQLVIMPLHPVRLPLRVLHRVRRPEEAPDEGIDQPAHGRRDRLEPFADGPADFAQRALDLFAG